jgi:T5orf172 domain
MEGPKHLYILRLAGDADAFLGERVNGWNIIKVGMSGSPAQRCDDHNRALPEGVYKWEILNSGSLSGIDAYPTSAHALAGERAIQKHLCISKSRSLGREFFLASAEAIHNAWLAGNKIAREFKK